MFLKKRPFERVRKVFEEGGDILSHLMAVPSALVGLTSLFGMGRGEPHCYNHLKCRSVLTLLNKLTYKKGTNYANRFIRMNFLFTIYKRKSTTIDLRVISITRL